DRGSDETRKLAGADDADKTEFACTGGTGTGITSVNADTLGADTLGTDTLSADTLGSDALGTDTIGSDALYISSVAADVQSVEIILDILERVEIDSVKGQAGLTARLLKRARAQFYEQGCRGRFFVYISLRHLGNFSAFPSVFIT